MGDRFDWEDMKIEATGGIYVRTFPAANQIVIDSKISEKPGFLANSIFVQSLLPKNHTIYIKKNGYFDYSKTLPVKENKVTKLENITLIKKDIKFGDLADQANYFSVAPDNQDILVAKTSKNIDLSYLSSDSPAQDILITRPGNILQVIWSADSKEALVKVQSQGSSLYYLIDFTDTKPAAIRMAKLDNSQQISFNPQDNSQIFYIKNDTIYSLKNNVASEILNNVSSYKISGGSIILASDSGIFESYDISSQTIQQAKASQAPATPVNGYNTLTSPDGLNIISFNKNSIYIASLAKASAKILLYKSPSEGIENCYWLNNNYIIFSENNKILISEIDYRGNVNIVTLPGINASQMYFNRQNGKIYALQNSELMSSEKITP